MERRKFTLMGMPRADKPSPFPIRTGVPGPITREDRECAAIDLASETTRKIVSRRTLLKGTAWREHVKVFENELDLALEYTLLYHR